MQRKVLFIVIIVALSNLNMFAQEVNDTLSVKEFYNQFIANDPSTVILDVRTPAEYEQSHLKGCILIDWKSPDFNVKIQQLNKNKKYLIYCKRGGRSSKALSIMNQSGFKSVKHMRGGIDAWIEAGYPVVTGK